ncbi:hypothetical protein [Roseateles amylovorans]|uniref:Uncharacterized protein n=1 Tax=Roseateles amylovorans TaxID=2978473 RepID=A0ABY6B1N2_9BURK|nr:hypothetical protein [Roseateles amylovorans]UXH79073.1 hypothetical protein N4261_03815 [Roseateles amylovorans]
MTAESAHGAVVGIATACVWVRVPRPSVGWGGCPPSKPVRMPCRKRLAASPNAAARSAPIDARSRQLREVAFNNACSSGCSAITCGASTAWAALSGAVGPAVLAAVAMRWDMPVLVEADSRDSIPAPPGQPMRCDALSGEAKSLGLNQGRIPASPTVTVV